MSTTPVISVESLSLDYRIGGTWLSAIADVDLAINPVQIHGLVGESGSGKSTLGLALLRYLAPNARVTGGRVMFEGSDLLQLDGREIERVWGGKTALVPQNPMDALNPSLRVGRQMNEVTQLHLGLTPSEAQSRAVEGLKHAQIADPDQVLNRFPHQLSGGMLQRVMIAMALSTKPRLIVLDEPTTALDVTTQAVILDLFRDLIKEEQSAALYVSHDLGTVAQLCDYVTVLYAGEVMESAGVNTLFETPRHPYTMGLLACLPSAATGEESRLSIIEGVAPSLAERSAGCVFADRCPIATEQCRVQKPPLETTDVGSQVRCWRWREIADGSVNAVNPNTSVEDSVSPHSELVLSAQSMAKQFGEVGVIGQLLGRRSNPVHALRDVSIQVRGRSTFGLVGESGSGKTTLARTLVALTVANEGEITLLDQPIALELRKREWNTLRNLRMVFQNPNDSLNPYRTIGQTIGRTVQKLGEERLTRAELKGRVIAHLESVGLSAAYYDRRPSQLSGGEKQRVAVARAFAPHPALIVADEPTSSLDVSVQAVILNLLKDLRGTEGASYIVISHDLEVVAYLSDYIAVMYLGEIVEQGSAKDVREFPSHPYTEALLSAAPVPDPRVRHRPIALRGDIPSPRNRPSGCPFHTRCPRKIGTICETTSPPVQTLESGHQIRCHHDLEELERMQREGPP